MASFLIQVGGPIVGSIAVERLWLRNQFPILYAGSIAPKSYGLVIAINAVASSLALVAIGFKASGARGKYKALAIEKGDADAEARFSYPKLYAEGFSDEARQFNCVQRGHQHALETYSQFIVLSLIGGFGYPITTTLGGLMWIYSRINYADGYATGDPKKRYQHWSSRWVWYSLLTVVLTSSAVAIDLAIA